jgi:hypothetical protein
MLERSIRLRACQVFCTDPDEQAVGRGMEGRGMGNQRPRDQETKGPFAPTPTFTFTLTPKAKVSSAFRVFSVFRGTA